MKIIIYLISISLFLLPIIANAVTLPGNWERLTCRIETNLDEGKLIGTGFLLRYNNQIFIVTNKHVVYPGKSVFHIKVRIPELDNEKTDSTNAITKDFSNVKYIKVDSIFYYLDPIYDLALIHVTEFVKILDVAVIPESQIGDDNMIIPGRRLFFLGYPRGLAGHTLNTPLVRSGIIAGEVEHKIILDGNVFGGSSGSPIFLDIDKLNHVEAQYLIGIISEQRTMPTQTDSAVQENIGIGIGIKISYIKNAIIDWLENLKKMK